MERDDIQGLLFSGYARLRFSACVQVRFSAGHPHAWLRRLLPRVSSGAWHEGQDTRCLNLAFTYTGLERLGLEARALEQFPREFREGMAHPDCAQRLGDGDDEAPANWSFGAGRRGGFDAVVLLYSESESELALQLAELQAECGRADLEAESLRTYLRADAREHFGFCMSASQPRFRGDGRGRSEERRLAAGEFVLGYPDEAGVRVRGPVASQRATTRESPPRVADGVDLGFNGSYLVLRLLEQRREAFRAWLLSAGAEGPLWAAKLVGRWPNGASLAQFPSAEPSAERARGRLSYAQDAQGLGCPLGAHVRRAAPRDALPEHCDVRRHRLLRRGRLYGEEGADAGLLFMALNADIARQFEVVQGRWLNGQHFSGLRAERDPLVGSEQGERRFTIQSQPFRQRIELPRLTRLLGGAYCFLPSLRALGYLADLRSLT